MHSEINKEKRHWWESFKLTKYKCSSVSQNHRILCVERDPQGSSSQALQGMVHPGINATTLVLLAPCSDKMSQGDSVLKTETPQRPACTRCNPTRLLVYILEKLHCVEWKLWLEFHKVHAKQKRFLCTPMLPGLQSLHSSPAFFWETCSILGTSAAQGG